MTVELWMLVAAVALTWVQIMLVSTAGLMLFPKWTLGNRDGGQEVPDWVSRAKRAAENMKENLPLFAILVLVVHVSGESNSVSALGAQIFVGARIAHAIIYALGVPAVRTLVWGVSIVGMVMIASALF